MLAHGLLELAPQRADLVRVLQVQPGHQRLHLRPQHLGVLGQAPRRLADLPHDGGHHEHHRPGGQHQHRHHEQNHRQRARLDVPPQARPPPQQVLQAPLEGVDGGIEQVGEHEGHREGGQHAAQGQQAPQGRHRHAQAEGEPHPRVASGPPSCTPRLPLAREVEVLDGGAR